jgi:hypothetical protein
MNANELADLLEVDSWYKLVTREEIAAMLRQQQVLIENLNGRIERMIEKQSHYEAMAHAGGFEAGRELGMKQERERNNEPVAYAMFRNGEYYDAIHPDEQAKTVGEYDIPLYTHPVKELTDEEILQIWSSVKRFVNAKYVGCSASCRSCVVKVVILIAPYIPSLPVVHVR